MWGLLGVKQGRLVGVGTWILNENCLRLLAPDFAFRDKLNRIRNTILKI